MNLFKLIFVQDTLKVCICLSNSCVLLYLCKELFEEKKCKYYFTFPEPHHPVLSICLEKR